MRKMLSMFAGLYCPPASIHHMFKVFGIALKGGLKQSNFPAPWLSMDVALVMEPTRKGLNLRVESIFLRWSHCEKSRPLRTVLILCPQAEAEAAWSANEPVSQKPMSLVCKPGCVFIAQKCQPKAEAWTKGTGAQESGLLPAVRKQSRLSLEFVPHMNLLEGSSLLPLWAGRVWVEEFLSSVVL